MDIINNYRRTAVDPNPLQAWVCNLLNRDNNLGIGLQIEHARRQIGLYHINRDK